MLETMLRSWRCSTLLIGLVLSGCGTTSRVVSTPQPQPQASESGSSAPAVEPVRPHADYLSLRPFRSYFSLVRVGAPAHHFEGWFHGVETCHVRYEIRSRSGELTRTGYSYGLLTDPGLEDVPESQRVHADAIRRDIEAQTPGASSIVLRYLGEYREIQIEEILARPSRDGTSGRSLTATLAAESDLSRIRGPALGTIDRGGSLYLERGPVLASRAQAPVWIDAVADRPGTLRVWSLIDGRGDDAAREALFDAVLTAARRSEAGAPPIAFTELAVNRDASLLPAGLDDGLQFSCYANRWRAHETLSAAVTAALEIGGEAEGRVSVGAEQAACWVRFELLEPLAEGVVGEHELTLALRWAIRLGAEHREGTTHLQARALVEAARIGILELVGSDAPEDAQVLRTTLSGERVEVHVGLTRQD